MHITSLLTPFLLLSSTLATPLSPPSALAPATLNTRQTAPVKPAPCVRNPATSVRVTKKRAQKFAKAFIYEQDISKAFEFIAADYINHNPLAQNGSDSAWGILSPIWAAQNFTAQRTAFDFPQSWVGYTSAAFGPIVDRFRWEGGCIVEHWDQGEVFPAGKECAV
ncbi:hypothetical protein IQ07DRAFT_549336 [Pyrenochaeta sp. DS3sAY3a]|nr:hypothetical protein IQ07DRAFT_549336 [Pyrenochaeta sp. DS3sAY3a]